MVASWISGENAAHPSSSNTTWYPRSAASRAVVSTQTLVTTPPTTSDEIPSERSRWSRPVELNVPYVVLFTTSSPGCGSRLLTMRAQGSARGGMAASLPPRDWQRCVLGRSASGRCRRAALRLPSYTPRAVRAHGRSRATSAVTARPPPAALLEVAQHAWDDGLAGPRERRGGIQKVLLHIDDHERGGARIEPQRGLVAMALKDGVPLVRSAHHRCLLEAFACVLSVAGRRPTSILVRLHQTGNRPRGR